MEPNCCSILSPPTRRTVRRSVPLPNSFTTFKVCKASSREGEKTTARAPTRALCARRRSIMGMTKAAVFPEPVLAMPTTSFLSRINGIAFRWIGVGTENPFRVIALNRCPLRPYAIC